VAGKNVKDIQLPVECVLVAIMRNDDLLLPKGDTVLMPNDKVVAITHMAHLQLLADLLGAQA